MRNYFTQQAQALIPILQKVRLLALDVDGVLTQCDIHVLEQGNNYMKSFNALDGTGIALVQRYGVTVAFITASRSVAIIKQRAETLRVSHYITGREDKKNALCDLLVQLQLDAEQCAYIGDDVIDMGAIAHSGVGISVPNGHPIVRNCADYVTVNEGGKGAVREICDLLLHAQGAFTTVYNANPL